MRKIILTIICLLSISWSSQLAAQNQSFVHIDKSFYVTGEIIWYKLYLPSHLSGTNTAIKSTLVNASGNNISSHFNATQGKTEISGYFKLPFDLSSEVYSLVFSGSRGKAFNEEIFAEAFVPIYNDLEATNATSGVEIQNYNEDITTNNLNIQVDLDKEIYNCREQVNAKVQVTDANGNPVEASLSISVVDTDLYTSTYQRPAIYPGNVIEKGDLAFSDKIYTKGAYSRGKQNKLLPNEIIGAYSSLENKLFYSVPDPSTGNFHVEYSPFKSEKPIQFFPYIEKGEDLNIELKKVGSPNNKQLVYTQGVIDYIDLSRKRKKLFQRYSTLESNLIPEETDIVYNAFKHNKTYKITEYKAFESMASFVKEVSTPLRLRLKDEVYEGAMYMPSKMQSFSEYGEYDPIYIVNGFLTRNSDFIARLDLSNVKELSMMYEPKDIRSEYKIFGASGIVNLRINAKDIVLPEEDQNEIFSISGFQADTPYPEFIPSEFDSNQPFFRPQLYWNGALATDKNGRLNFGYFQSDDVSTFVIEVVAKTADGKIATAQKTYNSVWQ